MAKSPVGGKKGKSQRPLIPEIVALKTHVSSRRYSFGFYIESKEDQNRYFLLIRWLVRTGICLPMSSCFLIPMISAVFSLLYKINEQSATASWRHYIPNCLHVVELGKTCERIIYLYSWVVHLAWWCWLKRLDYTFRPTYTYNAYCSCSIAHLIDKWGLFATRKLAALNGLS